jgi:uncharacterized glyoxalase superfamily metalloenzyme YdcJ
MSAPISDDMIREMFSARLSALCKSEMPRYRAMTELVARINENALASQPKLATPHASNGAALDIERHGAVRVGTAAELALLRRLFAVMGMAPVGYYDLSVAGLPVHSTAFRPTTDAALRRCPFRVFVSLLRLDLIPEAELRDGATAILSRRRIITPRGLELLERSEWDGDFGEMEVREFVGEAVEIFRWRSAATVSIDVYRRLHRAHPLLADICCFAGPHINHLAAPALDIDAVQRELRVEGFAPKDVIEGPPRRRCPILLRQTSFKALAEPIEFANGGEAFHSARFGEVEQRGAALTDRGRTLYDRLLAAASAAPPVEAYEQELARQFEAFPDDDMTLWTDGLAYFRYRPATDVACVSGGSQTPSSIQDLLSQGRLSIEPILYEDFLPASAAGIFRSNLSDRGEAEPMGRANRQSFEEALGCAVIDTQSLYASIEAQSLAASLEVLNLPRALPRLG